MSKTHWATGLTDEEIDALPPIGWVTIVKEVTYGPFDAWGGIPQVGERYPVHHLCPSGFVLYLRNSQGHQVSVNKRHTASGLEDPQEGTL